MKGFLTILSGALATLVILLAYGCGGTTDTPVATQALPGATTQTLEAAVNSTTTWVPPTALVGTPIPGAEATLTAAPVLPKGIVTITNSLGGKVVTTVEVAAT